MNEENKNELENEVVEETAAEVVAEEITEDIIEETAVDAETVIEETAVDAETVIEETVADAETAIEEVEATVDGIEVNPEAFENVLEAAPAKKSALPIIIISAIAVVILAVAAFFAVKFFIGNPYNNMGYINVTGRTIETVADEMGMSLEEFKEEFDLPKDMRGDTEEYAAAAMIPFSKKMEMIGMTAEEFKLTYGISEDVADDTPWGEVEAQIKLVDMIGESQIEQFKAYYELGDDVTADTLYGEIRNTVALKDKANYEAQQAEQEDQIAATEAEAEAMLEEDPAAEGAVVVEGDAEATEAPVAE